MRVDLGAIQEGAWADVRDAAAITQGDIDDLQDAAPADTTAAAQRAYRAALLRWGVTAWNGHAPDGSPLPDPAALTEATVRPLPPAMVRVLTRAVSEQVRQAVGADPEADGASSIS